MHIYTYMYPCVCCCLWSPHLFSPFSLSSTIIISLFFQERTGSLVELVSLSQGHVAHFPCHPEVRLGLQVSSQTTGPLVAVVASGQWLSWACLDHSLLMICLRKPIDFKQNVDFLSSLQGPAPTPRDSNRSLNAASSFPFFKMFLLDVPFLSASDTPGMVTGLIFFLFLNSCLFAPRRDFFSPYFCSWEGVSMQLIETKPRKGRRKTS